MGSPLGPILANIFLAHQACTRNCFIPFRYKVGLLKTLTSGLWNCSDYFLIHQEIDKIKKILTLNGYGQNFIDKIMYLFLNKKLCHTTKSSWPRTSENFNRITLPYVRYLTWKFLMQSYSHVNFHFAFQTVLKLGNFFMVKDKFPIELSSNVVYRFTCHCCQAMYVSKTCRHFGTRRGEHVGISARTGRQIQPDKNSAIFSHIAQTGHAPNLDYFAIIDRAENQYITLIKEVSHIINSKPALKGQIDQPFLQLLKNWFLPFLTFNLCVSILMCFYVYFSILWLHYSSCIWTFSPCNIKFNVLFSFKGIFLMMTIDLSKRRK